MVKVLMSMMFFGALIILGYVGYLYFGISAKTLLKPFEYRPIESKRVIKTGPGSRGYVTLGLISKPLVRSVLVSEDSKFYEHEGFDTEAVREAIEDHLVLHHKLRGASTITQQLAKNLFLSKERSFFRKFREAVLTSRIEATLTKKQILELYLNVICWGPDIYGIREAANHYFGKAPSEITPLEASFLAILIPNPRKYYRYYREKFLTRFAVRQMNTVLDRLKTVGILDEEQRQALHPSQLFAEKDLPMVGEGEDDEDSEDAFGGSIEEPPLVQ